MTEARHLDDPLVDLSIDFPEWQQTMPDLHQIATSTAKAALDRIALEAGAFSVSLLATDDDRIAELNTVFRAVSKPTNVLSWPAFNLAPAAPGASPHAPLPASTPGRTALGDVALAYQTCTREADAANLPLKNHVTHLILHGILHLLGFDHETDPDAERMEGIERAVLDGLGIADPYA